MPMEIIADSDMSAITSGRVDNDMAGQNGPVLCTLDGLHLGICKGPMYTAEPDGFA